MNKWAEFTVDTRKAGKAPLHIAAMDADYNSVEVCLKLLLSGGVLALVVGGGGFESHPHPNIDVIYSLLNNVTLQKLMRRRTGIPSLRIIWQDHVVSPKLYKLVLCPLGENGKSMLIITIDIVSLLNKFIYFVKIES